MPTPTNVASVASVANVANVASVANVANGVARVSVPRDNAPNKHTFTRLRANERPHPLAK